MHQPAQPIRGRERILGINHVRAAETPVLPPFVHRLVAWAPAVLALVLYLPVLAYDFVRDDYSFLVWNESIRDLRNTPSFFTDESTASDAEEAPGVYRPLRNLIWAVGYQLWELEPAGHHAVNIVLHAVNSSLVSFLVLALLGSPEGSRSIAGSPQVSGTSVGDPTGARMASAVVAGTLFALHPLATEAVAWIKALDDVVLATFCLLGAILVARRTRSSPGSESEGWPTLGLLLLQVGALASKETALVFPGLMVVAAVVAAGWSGARPLGPLATPVFRRWAALAGALIVGFLFVRKLVLGELGQLEEGLASGAALFWTQLRATAQGLWLVVWPQRLSADYESYPISVGPDVEGLLALSVVLGLALLGAIFVLRRRVLALSFAAGWWFLSILPVSNLVPTMQFLAERFLYVALVGPVVAVGLAMFWLSQLWPSRRRSLLLLLLLVCALFAARTAQRLPVWKGPVELYRSITQAAPSNVRGQMNLVQSLFNSGRYGESIDAIERLAALSPNHPTVWDLREDARVLAGVEGRLPELLRQLDSEPEHYDLHLILGELALRARYAPTARQLFSTGRELRPTDWRPRAGLAVAAALEHRESEARRLLADAVELAGVSTPRQDDSSELARWRAWVERGLISALLRDPESPRWSWR